jgi:hypothetical protein
MTTPWVIRQEPSSTFPLYTRGNVGEVFGNVVSPLTGGIGAIDSAGLALRLWTSGASSQRAAS